MKLFLLISFILSSAFHSGAQETQVKSLPLGKYETRVLNTSWEKGDIVLIDEERYKISSSQEVGEYRFSVTAQRLFFTSGPLKGVYAKAKAGNGAPQILLPYTENQQLGLKLAQADVVGKLKY